MSISVLVELSDEALEGKEMALGIADFSAAMRGAPGLSIDESFAPVPIGSLNTGFGLGAARPTQLVRADLEVSEDDLEELHSVVEAVEAATGSRIYADPRIAPISLGIDCTPRVPTGNYDDVVEALRVRQVWQQSRHDGESTIIGILDGGVDASQFPVTGGWSPDAANPPGSSDVVWGGHGNMCAFDALIAAPGAQLFDYAIGRAGNITATLSAALQSFQHALTAGAHGPRVLSNSWGLYQQAWDPFPPGHRSNYTHNPLHPFNRKVVEVMDAGILVCFAAGNCGISCPANDCGTDVGPGKSIRGANGLPRVLSVGAVNLQDQWIGYSSQGPSTMASDKPDVCCFSHFKGYTSSDSGTSTACPVLAGVLGLLKSIKPGLTQDRAQHILHSTSRQTASAKWSPDFGYGIVDAHAAFVALT